ncbi:GAF domain-containing protein [Natronomonas marina]|uniref:GAF domain-containing protein n=1 Tax=Natronomonas marina TaxID=2961939 RepID=UPI0020C96AE5|nr:GAF domain-containing protein [Natronomonas marina]
MTQGTRVLYVRGDDSRSQPARRLERRGFDLRAVEDAATALDDLGWPDCVVSEYDLPDADGIELLRAARERAPDLPFVLFTDRGSEAVASEAIAAGVTDYLPRTGGESAERLADRIERSATGTDRRADGRFRRLHDATRELMAETDPERIAELTTVAAREIVDASDAAVYLDDDGLELVAATGPHEGRTEKPPAAVERTHRTGDASPGNAGRAGGTDGETYLPLGDHGVFAVAASGTDALAPAEIRLATILAANAEAALDRAENETALRRERDDLAALFENIPDPAVETTMQDGEPIVERVNTAFEEVFGYDGERLRGENVDGYIVPEGQETEAEGYNERVETGEGFYGEVRRRTTDGLRDFILHVVAHDVGGTETRGYAIYTDITEQKQHQRELERQNRRIEALHDVTKRMKAAPDRTTIYDIVIDAAEEILAFDLSLIDEIEDGVLVPQAISSGVSLSDYYEETPIDRENNLAAETARTGETRVVDDLRASRYAPANFEYRSALSVPLGDYGVLQAVATEEAAFSTDDCRLAELLAEHAVVAIDRQKRERELEERAEELARQNERLDRFASVVSHDLRNPLSVARGRLDLARATGDEDHYRAVERAHERMDELVNGLLTLARRGELKSDPTPVELRSAAEQAWRTVETGDLELAIEDAPTVRADPERLRQLLENLFTNTAEHGDAATTVTVGGLDDGFYVADDGVGIPETEREAILKSGHSGTDEGTGLGLAIVETIAEAHDWTVSVVESADGGARFEFREDAGGTADE